MGRGGCSAAQNQEVDEETENRNAAAKCIRTDRRTDSQKQGDHWQSGETQKTKTRLSEEEGKEEVRRVGRK